MRSYSWILFGIVSLLIFVGSAVNLSRVYPIYIDTALRLRVEEIITLTAEQKGILLSGIEVRSLSSETVVLQYRDYMRGHDPITCYSISLTTPISTEIPCENN